MLGPLVVAAALMNAAMVAASAVSTILVADAIGPAVAGLPNTAGVLGTAAGAVLVGRLSARLGRAHALRMGYLVSVGGAALTVLAAVGAPIALLFIGMLLLGAGNAAALLSRYAAAEAVTPARQAAAMSTVVWAGTAGAVGGPFLFEPAERAVVVAGFPAIAGAFVVAVATTFGALVASTRIPAARVRRTSVDVADTGAAPTSRSTTVVAGAVMLVGQLVMVSLMTSVPVHVRHHGQGIGALGMMLSVHTLGMFAFAPLTGWLIDRWGPRPVMLAGLVTVAGSALIAAGPLGAAFAPALFLLGYGWNLCYLGGSALLTRSGPATAAGQARRESRVEASIWAVSAIATGTSTWLFAEGGFALLALVSVVLALPLLVIVVVHRPQTARAELCDVS
jgi:MFS family permease